MHELHLRSDGKPPINGYSHAVASSGRVVAVSGQVPSRRRRSPSRASRLARLSPEAVTTRCGRPTSSPPRSPDATRWVSEPGPIWWTCSDSERDGGPTDRPTGSSSETSHQGLAVWGPTQYTYMMSRKFRSEG